MSYNVNVDSCVCLVLQTGMSFYNVVLFISLSLCWSGMFSSTVYYYTTTRTLCALSYYLLALRWGSCAGCGHCKKIRIRWTLWKITESRTRWKGFPMFIVVGASLRFSVSSFCSFPIPLFSSYLFYIHFFGGSLLGSFVRSLLLQIVLLFAS